MTISIKQLLNEAKSDFNVGDTKDHFSGKTEPEYQRKVVKDIK